MFRLVIFSCLFLAKFADSRKLPRIFQGKIIGGKDTDITEVPYQASILYHGKHWCGGSIIGPTYILTAAHCVEGIKEDQLSVRAGSAFRCFGQTIKEVDKVISHEMYNNNTANYDAAILVLKEPLKIEKKIKPIELAEVEPQENEMVRISGWGFVNKQKKPSNYLQSVLVPVVSKELCKDRYKANITITDEMFCAGFTEGKKDACKGDSGGPAVVEGQLAGIVSWGEGCGDENSPGVYTSVAKILTWIKSKTKE